MSYRIAARRPGVGQDLLDAYRTIATSTIGHLTDSGYLRGIRPLSDGMRMLGPVVTVKLFTPDGSVIREALLASEPGDVLVIECVGDPDCACWGELRTLAGLAKGLAGVVVAGAVTDVGALRRHRLPVFCQGVSALTTRSLGVRGEVNQPVRVGAVPVQPGDLAIGDDDGVFILAAQQAHDLLAALLAKEHADQMRRDELMLKVNARRLSESSC